MKFFGFPLSEFTTCIVDRGSLFDLVLNALLAVGITCISADDFLNASLLKVPGENSRNYVHVTMVSQSKKTDFFSQRDKFKEYEHNVNINEDLRNRPMKRALAK